eukprot:TRINITY_DN3205_c0_g4_i2.p2 TRINITY_DN3205_c0_g4~~TRINITY_DN3205_c0_g4_i2.p2  ORF type:complete len:400 (+),score=110.13 TRINITY_DN3205_c0_g4_i2:1193-2392(+)
MSSKKNQIYEAQMDFASKGVTQALFRFDDPNYRGNQSATGADVIEAADLIRKSFQDMFKVLEQGGDTPTAAKELSEAVVTMLNNAKGFSEYIEGDKLKHALLDATRNTGEGIVKFLFNTKSMGAEPLDEGQMLFLKSNYTRVKSHLDNAVGSVEETYKVDETSNINLEDIAERELMNAAKIIEDAARRLAAQQKTRVPNPSDELDVEGAIMSAAMAITQATQILVNAATEAQKERVAKGHGTDPAKLKYNSDPMWMEGLISAARAVAEATRQLVDAANSAAQGKIEEAALIAASKSVASSTAQLVAACNSKSEGNSPTRAKLDSAAESVTKATRLLVDAARKAGSFEDEAHLQRIRDSNYQGSFKEEMEQQTKILDLEKQLELQRKVLFTMRKKKYAKK